LLAKLIYFARFMYMHSVRLEQLQDLFPRLTRENQQYVLGVTEGLNHAQKSLDKPAGAGLRGKEGKGEAGNRKWGTR